MPAGTEAWNVSERDWPADGPAGEKLRYLLRWAILRMGYGPEVDAPTPRRPPEEMLVS